MLIGLIPHFLTIFSSTATCDSWSAEHAKYLVNEIVKKAKKA